MTNGHMTILERKEREFVRREEDILAAALSLFNRDDWQTVTIDQIAAKAEIGKGTIYKHFESKDEIYARLVVDFFRDQLGKMRELDQTLPVPALIAAQMRIFWESFQGRPEYRRLERYCRREDFRKLIGDKMSRELELLDEEFMTTMAPVIERGIREGVLEPKPVVSIMLALHATMIGLLEVESMECSKSAEMDSETMFKEVVDFAMRGIAARGEKRS